MSDDATPRTGLPYLAAAQAQKHVTVNAALALLDALVGCALQSRTAAAQPASPGEGDLYLLPAGAAGAAWSAFAAGSLASFQDGAWLVVTAPVGLVAWVRDEARLILRADDSWMDAVAGLTTLAHLQAMAIGAAADPANPLTVAAASSLFTHVGGDARVAINKATVAATASVLVERGFSGRAEIGLCGDDDLHIKVSADGAAWRDAMIMGCTDGAVGVGGAYASGIPLSVQPGPSGQVNAGYFADVGGNLSGTAVFGANLYARSDDNSLRLRLAHSSLGGAALVFHRSAFNEAQVVFQPAGAADAPVVPAPAMTWRGADSSTHANGPFYPAAYSTAALPAASSCPGAVVTDTTRNKLVRSDGNVWALLG